MLPVLFAVLYSLLTHWAIATDHPQVPLIALSLFAAIATFRGFRQQHGWLLPGVVTVTCCLLAWSGAKGALATLALAPILIYLSLLWMFGQSLRPGRTALITGIALHMGAEPTPQLLTYTRQVTKIWCGFFCLMATTASLLAVLAPPAYWSYFSNIISYLLISLLFLVEYAVRVRVLPEENQNLFQFLRRLLNLNFRSIAEASRHD